MSLTSLIKTTLCTQLAYCKGNGEFYADHKAKEHRQNLDMCYISHVTILRASAKITLWLANCAVVVGAFETKLY